MDGQDEMAPRVSPELREREVLVATKAQRVNEEKEVIEDTEATKAVPGRKAVLDLAALRGMRVREDDILGGADATELPDVHRATTAREAEAVVVIKALVALLAIVEGTALLSAAETTFKNNAPFLRNINYRQIVLAFSVGSFGNETHDTRLYIYNCYDIEFLHSCIIADI